MSERATNRPSRWVDVEVMTSDPQSTRQLTDDQRRIVAGFTQPDVGRRSLDYCVAILLREGMDLHALPMLENLTRGQLREAVDSVMRRVALRMDRPHTPPNAEAIERDYQRSLDQPREGARGMAYLYSREAEAESPKRPQDDPCGRLIDWDALEVGGAADAAESN